MPRTDTSFIGRSVEGLSLAERNKLTGFWVAIELYSPERLPLRKIEAVGKDARECIEGLRARGLNPARYEYQALAAAYE